MEQLRNKRLAGILPNYYRKAGWLVVLITIALTIVLKYSPSMMVMEKKDLVSTFLLNGIILGLLLIALARDKEESETTLLFKLKALNFTFVGAVLYVLVRPLTDLALSVQSEQMSAQGLVLSMLFAYLFMYFFQKRAR